MIGIKKSLGILKVLNKQLRMTKSNVELTSWNDLHKWSGSQPVQGAQTSLNVQPIEETLCKQQDYKPVKWN